QYVLADGISELTLAFPASLEPRAFWWNRRELPSAPTRTGVDGTSRYDLVLADRAGSGARLLTIDYLAKVAPAAHAGAAYALETPRFPDELSSAEVRWQIELPFNQHLFTEPEGFSAGYRWRPGRPFWSREPEWTEELLERWVGPQAGLSPWSEGAAENRYVFS